MKKITLLATSLAVSFCFTAFADSTLTFSDVTTSDWHYEYVQSASEFGIVNGYEDGTFRPENSITIAELTTLLTNLWGQDKTYPSGNHWGEQSVQNALSNGWITSIPSNYDQILNRGEVADIIYNALDVSSPSTTNYFTDTTSVSVNSLYELGVINGKTTTTFAPQDDINRAEISTILVRVINSGYAQVTPNDTGSSSEQTPDTSVAYTYELPVVTTSSSDSSLASVYKAILLASFSPDIESFSAKIYTKDMGGVDLQTYVNNIHSDYFYTDFSELYASNQDLSPSELIYAYSATTDGYNIYIKPISILAQRNIDASVYAEKIINELFADGTLNENMSDYDMAKALYVWFILNHTYDTTYSNIGRDAYGILTNGTGVCSGYTSAYNMLCNIVGIQTLSPTGTQHQWSCLYLNGDWTYVDVTWGDPIGQSPDYYDMSYFDLTKEEIADENNHKFLDTFDPYNSYKYNMSGIDY